MTLWMILIMLIGFWLVSRFANRQQQKMLEEQKRRTDEALVRRAVEAVRAVPLPE